MYRRCLPIVVCLLMGCAGGGRDERGTTAAFDPGPAPRELRPFTRIAHPRIDECSGIVYHQGAFWVHNDSGDEPVLYRSRDLAFRDAEVLPVPGASAVDWEDITVYRGDLLACDIGDNRRERDTLQLYQARYLPGASGEGTALPSPGASREGAAPPRPGAPRASSPGRLERVATYPFRYPDGSHDAEASFTIDDQVYLVTKDRGEGTGVYRFDALRSEKELAPGELNVPRRLANLEIGDGEMVTAGTYDPGSGTVVLLTYSGILEYPRDRLRGKPAREIPAWARQAEAICFQGNKLVFANEERDVFVVDRFLSDPPSALLPPRAEGRLRITGPAGLTAENEADRFSLPLQEAGPRDSFRWGLGGDRLFVRGEFEIDDGYEPTDPSRSWLGSVVLLSFAREPHRSLSGSEAAIAIGSDPSGHARVWLLRNGDPGGKRSGIDGANVAGGIGDADTAGGTGHGVLEFEVEIPEREIFTEGLPDRFLFDLHAAGLRRGSEPYFSGPGVYAAFRPFVWGEITRSPGETVAP